MNNISLGQYIHRDSIIHQLDPRAKLISSILLLVVIFLIPSPLQSENVYLPFISLGILLVLLLLIILLTKISIIKYLKSVSQIFVLLLFTFVLQLITRSEDGITILDIDLHFTYISLVIIVALLFLFIIFRKYLRAKILLFIGLFIVSIYILSLNIGPGFGMVELKLYRHGLYVGAFFIIRIFIAIMSTTVLSLTTKPTDLTSAIEWLLFPLTLFKINVSLFGMLISLSLRFIPTLFNEANKILKAQASRGVDFKEGSLFKQIGQIVSLLIPMFVISYKRALDLADAMEARAYVPGEKRTRINILKFNVLDIILIFLSILLLVSIILWRIFYAV